MRILSYLQKKVSERTKAQFGADIIKKSVSDWMKHAICDNAKITCAKHFGCCYLRAKDIVREGAARMELQTKNQRLPSALLSPSTVVR